MKISKIFAGMSAAAMLAAMTASLPASAEGTEIASGTVDASVKVTKEAWGLSTGFNIFQTPSDEDNALAWSEVKDYGIVDVTVTLSDIKTTGGTELTAADFGANVFGMGTTKWDWQTQGDGKFETATATFQADLTQLNPKEDDKITYGIQVFVNDTSKVAVGDEITYKAEYSIATNPDVEPEVTYNTKTTVDGTGYSKDWGDSVWLYDDLTYMVPEDGMKVTIDYELLDGYDYYLAAPMLGQNWKRIYDESSESQNAAISGVTLKSSLTAEEIEATTDPILQNDGYLVFKESGQLTFNITQQGLEFLKQWAADNPGEDEETGEEAIWYGLGFQVYGVNITKATFEYNTDAPEPEKSPYKFTAFEMWSDSEWNPVSNWDTVANGGHGVDAEISADQTHYTVSFGPGYLIPDPEDPEKSIPVYEKPSDDAEAVKWLGAGVWCVDIEGLADAIGASSKGYEKEDGSEVTAADKKQLAVDAGLKISNVTVLVDGEEFYKIPDDKLLYGDIEGNGKIRIELQNMYGAGTMDENSEFFIKEFYDKAYDLEGSVVEVAFDIEGVPEEPAETPEEPTDPEDGEGEGTEDEGEGTEDEGTEDEGTEDEGEVDDGEEEDGEEDEDADEEDEDADEEEDEDEDEDEDNKDNGGSDKGGNASTGGSNGSGSGSGSNNDGNPKTGAAALALGTVALAGAAVVISKRK